MEAKQGSLTKKDLQAIKKIIHEAVHPLLDDIKEIHAENVRLVEKLNHIVLKMEKISIKEELIHDVYMDVLVLVKLHNKKIKDLEKKLESQPELRHS